MNRILTLAICTLFLIAVLGFAIFFTPNTTTAPAGTVDAASYTNATHGFSLAYPKTLSLLEYTPDIATIGTPIDGGIEGVADVRVLIIEGTPGMSLEDTAARDLAALCAAAGPTSSFSCTGVERIAPFTAASGATGFELFLTGELTSLGSGAVTTVRKGPYYLFPLSTGAMATKLLVVHAPLNQSADEANAPAIRTIAESVRLGE